MTVDSEHCQYFHCGANHASDPIHNSYSDIFLYLSSLAFLLLVTEYPVDSTTIQPHVPWNACCRSLFPSLNKAVIWCENNGFRSTSSRSFGKTEQATIFHIFQTWQHPRRWTKEWVERTHHQTNNLPPNGTIHYQTKNSTF